MGTDGLKKLVTVWDSSRDLVIVGLWEAVGWKSRKRGECWGDASVDPWWWKVKDENPGELGADPKLFKVATATLREGDETCRRNMVVQGKERWSQDSEEGCEGSG